MYRARIRQELVFDDAVGGLDAPSVPVVGGQLLEVVTPCVPRSEYPATNDVGVPWRWSVDDESRLRHREEKIVERGDVSRCEIIDHGQVVGYTGDRPVESRPDEESTEEVIENFAKF